MTRRPKMTRQQREAEVSKEIADYLIRTGFRSLGDALAFYAGSAAPLRSDGMIEVRETKNETPAVKPDRCSGPSLADVVGRLNPARYEEYYDAAEAHTDWDHDGDRLSCRNPRTRQNTPQKLVEWYRRGK
jgi:hypothetical protein